MEIRRATRDEVAEVDALLAAAGLPALPHGQPLSNLLVALEDGTVVGAVALEVAARRGLLRSLVVREGHRGKGLGSGLVSSLISRGHELGLKEIYALTETADDFFTGRAFTAIDRADVPPEIRATREFREQCPESARVLRFQLETRL